MVYAILHGLLIQLSIEDRSACKICSHTQKILMPDKEAAMRLQFRKKIKLFW